MPAHGVGGANGVKEVFEGGHQVGSSASFTIPGPYNCDPDTEMKTGLECDWSDCEPWKQQAVSSQLLIQIPDLLNGFIIQKVR